MTTTYHYGKPKEQPFVLEIIGKDPTKELKEFTCSYPSCNEKGMAYIDPNSTIQKAHFCILHNPLINKTYEEKKEEIEKLLERIGKAKAGKIRHLLEISEGEHKIKDLTKLSRIELTSLINYKLKQRGIK